MNDESDRKFSAKQLLSMMSRGIVSTGYFVLQELEQGTVDTVDELKDFIRSCAANAQPASTSELIELWELALEKSVQDGFNHQGVVLASTMLATLYSVEAHDSLVLGGHAR